MKVSEMIAALEKIQKKSGNDVEMMFQGPNHDGIFSVQRVDAKEVEDDDEFPKSWRMPKGFKYILIEN